MALAALEKKASSTIGDVNTVQWWKKKDDGDGKSPFASKGMALAAVVAAKITATKMMGRKVRDDLHSTLLPISLCISRELYQIALPPPGCVAAICHRPVGVRRRSHESRN